MRCIEVRRMASRFPLWPLLLPVLWPVLWLTGCTGAPPSTPAETPPSPSSSTAPAPVHAPTPAPAVAPSVSAAPALPPPRASRTWAEYRRQAAERLVAASPQGSYLGTVPDVLLAIPVVEVEVNRDGSVRRIEVLRHPRQAKDTTELALAAVRRAAPFGDVSHLPRPWKFAETFLFDDHRRFKPRTLEE